MENCFILIAIIGIFYCFGNLYLYRHKSATKTKIFNVFSEKILKKIFILFCFLIFACEIFYIYNFLADNFYYASVFDNSSQNQSLIYKIIASYSGQNGTFLFWLSILSFIGLLFSKSLQKKYNYSMQFVALIRAIYVVFPIILSFALFAQNPFIPTVDKYPNLTEIPVDGLGLKYILQSPYNLLHPPLLFIGFSFLYLPYIITISGLLSKNIIDKNGKFYLLKITAKYNKFGLIFLSSGILLGSFWAYYSFGWGGFWGWDPIENAAFIPMILSLILLHLHVVNERNNGMLKTSLIIPTVTFPTILLCTFLARSKAMMSQSMHAYSETQTVVSNIILAFMLLILIGSIIIYMSKLKYISQNYKPVTVSKFISQSLIISTGIVVLLCISFVVFVGIVLPILMPIFGENSISITPSFYLSWLIPLAIIMLILLGIVVFLEEKSIDFTTFSNRILLTFIFSITVMIFSFYNGINQIEYFLLVFATSFAFFAQMQNFFRSLIQKKAFSIRKFGTFLSHLGVCIFIISAMLFGNFEKKFTVELEKDKIVKLNEKYDVKFKKLEIENRSESLKYNALIEIIDDKNNCVEIAPNLVISKTRKSQQPEIFPDAKRLGINDLYFVMLNYFEIEKKAEENNDSTTISSNKIQTIIVEFSIKPFIIFVWFGGIILILGILFTVKSSKK